MFANKRFLQLSVFFYTVCLTVQVMAAETAKAAAPVPKSKETLLSLLIKGGPLMIPLGLCSLIALTIAIERFLSFKLLYSTSTNFIENYKKAHGADNIEINVLKEFCGKSKTVIARILESGIKKWQVSKDWTLTEKALEDVSDREVRRMKRSLRPLKNIAAISPLLGLLGTVFGMIHAFQTVALTTASFGKADKLASGIYEAMVTTAAGLSVAIPTLLVFHFLNNRAETYADEIETICDQFLDKFIHKTDSTGGENK